jgi:hypothetical protein
MGTGCGAALGAEHPWWGEAGWAERAKRPNRPAGLLGRLGRNLKRKPFQNKNCIFEFTWPLEIYARRLKGSLMWEFFLISS